MFFAVFNTEFMQSNYNQSLRLHKLRSIMEIGQKHSNHHWKRITTNNPVHQRFNKIRNSHNQPRDPVAIAIKEKRDEEYNSRRGKFEIINCMPSKCMIDPILYLPAFSKDRHRLIKWRMHWLPSYPLKDCRCGHKTAHRTHFSTCSLLEPLMQELLDKFGTIPLLPYNIQPLDHILNSLPRSEMGLAMGNRPKIWPALIQVFRKIDSLSHPDDLFDDDEPAPEEAMDFIPTTAIDTFE